MIARTLLVLLIVASVGSCTRATPQSDAPPTPAELVRVLFTDAWNTGQIPDVLAARAGDQVRFHYRGTESLTSIAHLEELIAHWRSAFPDLRMELDDLVAQDDTVAVRVRYSGTHKGDWFGIPPTGRFVNVEEMMFFRFEGERLVEAWEVDDQLTMRTQMGLLGQQP